MARPFKEGLEYFPLDVDLDMDDKIALIEARYGLEGFGIIIKLFMKIYKNSYYYTWSEKEQLLFSKRNNVDINLINNVINDCLKWELFDHDLFHEFKILTSRGIQRRYLKAVERRKEVKILKHFLLLDSEEINVYNNLIIVDINNRSSNITNIIGTQSKVKESKVKESKVKESKVKDNKVKDNKVKDNKVKDSINAPSDPKPISNSKSKEKPNSNPKSETEKKIDYAEFVKMTETEYESLCARVSERGAERCIEILDNYKGSSGKPYKSDYRTILNWVVDRYKEEIAKAEKNNRKGDNHDGSVENRTTTLSGGFKMATGLGSDK